MTNLEAALKYLSKRWPVFPVTPDTKKPCLESWKEYQNNGMVCGVPLPKGLKESEKLPQPIFTPARFKSFPIMVIMDSINLYNNR